MEGECPVNVNTPSGSGGRIRFEGTPDDTGYRKSRGPESAAFVWRRERDSNSWYGLPRTLAERTRFELVVRVTPYVGLANRWFQPLTHLSGYASRERYSPERVCKYRIFLGNFKTMRPKFPVFVRSFCGECSRSRLRNVLCGGICREFRRWMQTRCVGRISDAAGPDSGKEPVPAGRPSAKVQICPAVL